MIASESLENTLTVLKGLIYWYWPDGLGWSLSLPQGLFCVHQYLRHSYDACHQACRDQGELELQRQGDEVGIHGIL